MRNVRVHCAFLLGVAFCLGSLPQVSSGAEFFAAADGTPQGAGTRDDPWDITTALAGTHPVRGGDTLWIRGGTYRSRQAYERKGGGFEVKLAGRKESPVHVRACAGERVTIDGGLVIAAPGGYLWLWDLEITVAPDRPVPRETKTPGSHPNDLGVPGGGLTIHSGTGCKYINLVIHGNVHGGMNWWVGSTDSEVYGCIIVNNGWKGPDRNHGHCIYTQNREGTKTIANCIMTTPWGRGQYTVHAYGSSRAYVDNFVVEENICYGKGSFLVGGGRPSRSVVVSRNILYNAPMQIGYSAPFNHDCAVEANTVIGAGITVKRYKRAVVRDNVLMDGALSLQQCEEVDKKDNRVVKDRSSVSMLLPNRYDPNRAHLAVYNAGKEKGVAVTVSPFLKPGDSFRILDPEDFFGKPVLEGTCGGEAITVPVAGPFAAYVLVAKR